MAMQPPEQQVDPTVMQEAAKFQRPIPGQSLTNDPENPKAFEKPPKHTNLQAAQMDIFQKLIKEDVYVPMMELLDTGEASIMELTQNILYSGFRAGQWNPDMMLLLAEPTAYTLMALAERADIEFRIDDEPDEEEEMMGKTADMKAMIDSKAPESANIPASALPKEITENLDKAPVDSLIKRPEESGMPPESDMPPESGMPPEESLPTEASLPPEEESLLG